MTQTAQKAEKEDPTRWAEFGPCRGALRRAKVTLDSVKPLRVRRIDNSRQKVSNTKAGRWVRRVSA